MLCFKYYLLYYVLYNLFSTNTILELYHSSLRLAGLDSTSPWARQEAHQQKEQGLRAESAHEELPAQQKSM